MSSDRVTEVTSWVEHAKARLLSTGELFEQVGGGRAPARSETFRQASAELHRAEQARNRLLVEMVGDAEAVPHAVAQQLGLTGRHAASLLRVSRTGSERLRNYTFGLLNS
ncbi:hypothetical protein [Nocardia nova]|uniref:hypothetical protein n=1 Tax=Nocardia nova TaxID=37330 RepID=UPI0011DDE904|nr:hypothetical protein [Nocardia nova]